MSDATLRSRPAAYAVMGECLRVQSTARSRGPLARVFGISPLHPDAVSWYQGALGELEVGRELQRLGPEWTVLHAVPVGTGTSDIDHVVIGSAGVFTINTKRHKGKKVWVGGRRLLVSGQKTDHLRDSRYEAGRASKLLTKAVGETVEASALLVIVGAQSITAKERPSDVTVLSLGQLVRWLNKRKSVLTETELAAIVRVAEDPATWHRDPDAAGFSHDADQFHALRREEDASLRVRFAWLVLVMIGAGVFLAKGGFTLLASTISGVISPLFGQ